MGADSFGDFTCYFRGAFFGRDAGSKDILLRNGDTKTMSWRAASGLTQWVANNFEVLDLGPKPPTEGRKVDTGNRSSWTPLAYAYLERLFGGSSNRTYVLRRSMEFRQKDQWELFPHPDEAKQMNLIGMKGDVPFAIVSIDPASTRAADQNAGDELLQLGHPFWLVFSVCCFCRRRQRPRHNKSLVFIRAAVHKTAVDHAALCDVQAHLDP